MRPSLWLLSTAILLLTACGNRQAAQVPSQAAPAPASGAQASSASAGSPRAFERSLSLQGASVQVSSPNDSSLSTVTITVSGPGQASAPIAREVDGTVVGAEVGDLDGNGAPEVYVFASSAGSGSYGSVLAFALEPGQAPAEIALPDLGSDPKLAEGYMGHDEFAIAGQALRRRFPVYGPGDSNAAPSGRTRQLEYRLSRGAGGGFALVPGPASES